MSAKVGVDGYGGVIFPRAVNASITAGAAISLVRYRPDGTLDSAFGAGTAFPLPDLDPTYSPLLASAIALWQTPTGGWSVVLHRTQYMGTGWFTVSTESTDVVRFRADGAPDASFAQLSYVGFTRGTLVRLESGNFLRTDYQNGVFLARGIGDARVEGTMVEYYHPALDHYFMTLDGFEAALLDDHPEMGWVRTGRTFGSLHPFDIPGTSKGCRFYGDPVIGPNSHFYSTQDYECQGLLALQQSTPPGVPAWHFEAYTFSATNPVDGQCPPNLSPVYRAFSGPVSSAAGPNHRYTTDVALYQAMLAKGFIGEGVHFCAPPRPSRSNR
jgi:hypothetical protein